jgi:hypothetical protein
VEAAGDEFTVRLPDGDPALIAALVLRAAYSRGADLSDVLCALSSLNSERSYQCGMPAIMGRG